MRERGSKPVTKRIFLDDEAVLVIVRESGGGWSCATAYRPNLVEEWTPTDHLEALTDYMILLSISDWMGVTRFHDPPGWMSPDAAAVLVAAGTKPAAQRVALVGAETEARLRFIEQRLLHDNRWYSAEYLNFTMLALIGRSRELNRSGQPDPAAALRDAVRRRCRDDAAYRSDLVKIFNRTKSHVLKAVRELKGEMLPPGVGAEHHAGSPGSTESEQLNAALLVITLAHVHLAEQALVELLPPDGRDRIFTLSTTREEANDIHDELRRRLSADPATLAWFTADPATIFGLVRKP